MGVIGGGCMHGVESIPGVRCYWQQITVYCIFVLEDGVGRDSEIHLLKIAVFVDVDRR